MDERTIVLKPSSELIPDEFEHFDKNSKTLVHLFTDDEKDANVQTFSETMRYIGYSVPQENIHHLKNDDFHQNLKDIQGQAADSTGLIVFVSCNSTTDGKLNLEHGDTCSTVAFQDIYKKFDAQNCKDLKNKPKIFIFEVKLVSLTVVDSAVRKEIPFEKAYDTPVEADLLIVHNTTRNNQISNFVPDFCENIRNHGQHEHVITLASCIKSKDYQPLIISTLTRKFYFSPSAARGHHLHIHNHHEKLTNVIKELKDLSEARSKINCSVVTRRGAKSSKSASVKNESKHEKDGQGTSRETPRWKY